MLFSQRIISPLARSSFKFKFNRVKLEITFYAIFEIIFKYFF